MEKTGFDEAVLGGWLEWLLVLSVVALVAPNVASNAPAVLLFNPEMERMAATLAGHLTLTGSLASLLVAESAREVDRMRFEER